MCGCRQLVLLMTLTCVGGQAASGQPSSDLFDLLRLGEVHTLSEVSSKMAASVRPTHTGRVSRLPTRPLLPHWQCCHLSSDLVNWRLDCNRSGADAAGQRPLAAGCMCCNQSDSGDEADLGCYCFGANVTRVPQTLPPEVRLIVLVMTGVVEIDADQFLPYADHLRDIVIAENWHLRRIRGGAFRRLPHLLSIYINHAPSLENIEDEAWQHLPALKVLRVVGTGLEHVPNLAGLQTGSILHMVDLDGNKIKTLPPNSIKITADQLSLVNNRLGSISYEAFNGSFIGTLQLQGNQQLKHLDPLAFQGLGGLRTIDLSGTALRSLPTRGLEHIETLVLRNVPSLRSFPSVYRFRSIREARLTYPYHCCAFSFPDRQDPERHRQYQQWRRQLQHHPNCSRSGRQERRVWPAAAEAGPSRARPLPAGGRFHAAAPHEFSRLVCDEPPGARRHSILCSPEPDAFNPCEDIMGYKALRVTVWVVVITTLVGNTTVLVVLVRRNFKLTTPEFLMCNLALADLCMGVYLLAVASMDVRTAGVYFNYAIDWQEGVGCKVAGFLTVFASELSVVTLVAITCERWYAITNAIYLTKRLGIAGAVRVMAAGWLYSAGMAALPLVGVGSYSVTSICLPMVSSERDVPGLVYLLFLLLGNGTAFLLITWFYLRMYYSIRTVERGLVRPNDLKVAKRMALLVFTDFACWAPIAFFGVTAVGGMPFIGVTDAKILLVFFYPINACANPYLYAIFTRQFRKQLRHLAGGCQLVRRPGTRRRARSRAASPHDALKLSAGSRSGATQPRSGQTVVEMLALKPARQCGQ